MKLSSAIFNTSLDFEASTVWNVVVENPVFLRKIILGLQEINENENDSFLLYDNGKLKPIKDNIEVIQALLPFDLNTKEILSSLAKQIEKHALSPQNYLETQTLLHAISAYLDKLALDFSSKIVFDKLTVASLLKAAGMEIIPDDNCLHVQVIQYMKLVRELVKDRIFVFLNLLDLLSHEEREIIIKEMQLNRFHVILLESHVIQELPHVTTLIIDKDLCELVGS